jgi:hypothetical protein
VAQAGRPLFLKMVYHGPAAMEELHRYDPTMVIGILGGSAGTTYDAFKLLAEAQKYGAKVALFGRKINNAENQFAFIRFLRLIADGEITPEEAVPAYHSVLQRLGIRPHRLLEEDSRLQTGVMSYGGSGRTVSVPAAAGAPPASSSGVASCSCGCKSTAAQPVPNTPAQSTAGASEPRSTYLPRRPAAEPDFSRMTPAEKLAYNRAERDRIFG